MARPASDEELISAARAGDGTALDELLARHYDRIHRICRRIAGNDADGLDATQEALIAIVRGLERFDGRARFTTWSYRVATNACLDELRRRRRRPVPDLVDALETVDPGPSVADQVIGDIEVETALAQLPEEFRAAVALRDVADLSYAEIAEVLQIPPGTVRSRIARGRAALASALAGNPEATPRRPSDRGQASHPDELRNP